MIAVATQILPLQNWVDAVSDVSLTTTSSSFVSVTNATLSITTTGARRIVLGLRPTITTNYILLQRTVTPDDDYNLDATIRLMRNSVEFYRQEFGSSVHLNGDDDVEQLMIKIPSSSLQFVDYPATPGTYTYELQAKVNQTNNTLQIANGRFYAWET